MSSAVPWGPVRSFHHPTLQTLDGEEEERRIYYLSRSESRYTNFSRFRCSFTMDRSEGRPGGSGQKSKRLPIKNFHFYLGHETSVLAHKRQTAPKVCLDMRDFLSEASVPSPLPSALVHSRHSLLHVLPSSCPVEDFFFQLCISSRGALGKRQ